MLAPLVRAGEKLLADGLITARRTYAARCLRAHR